MDFKKLDKDNISLIHPRTGQRLINIPEKEIPKEPKTIDGLDKDLRRRIKKIRQEFINGLDFIRQHDHTVTFFGSAQADEDESYYKQATNLAKRLADEGIDIITGGGPGVMEAANKGASQSKNGDSLGLNIDLPNEQILNPYVEDNVEFHYFFVRKVALTFSAEAFVFFPGGYGTLDEFFEMMTLVQTEKIQEIPIILFGADFWQDLNRFIHETLKEKYTTIDPDDTELYTICDSQQEAVDIIKSAPMREE
ncbi:MAG: TIGR00730 family Rossman fold protein [Parcubacteria group bacterium SW_4_46_8]|nr:MAG: TIGR00730 family Rossman fold protein [Parcubacteria group bacterium SW_4_46_8]